MSATVTTPERMPWPDAAKGISVALIVVLHLWAIHLVYWVNDPLIMGVLVEVVTWTVPLRIPLFFFISGYFASRSLARPWRVAWHGRVFGIVYLYLGWSAFAAVFVWMDARVNGFEAVNPWASFVENLWAPHTHLWYLWALVALFVSVWVSRRLPSTVVVAIAGMLTIAAPFVLPHPYAQVGSAALFYVAGARLPVIATWITSRARPWIMLIGGAAYVASMLLGPTGPYGFADPLTSTIGVAAVIALLASAAHANWARVFRWLGRNTLPVFIFNSFVFILLNDLLRHSVPLQEMLSENEVLTALYIVLVIVITIAGSVLVRVAADRVKLGWLFAMPRSWLRSRAS